MGRRSLRHPALGMAAGTLLSRGTGLARTVAVASALGVTAVGDAYNTANTTPNMLFQLAVGGVLSASVVPLLVREEDRRRDEAASVLLTLALVVGAAAAVALVLLAPFVIEVLTVGASGRSDRAQLVELGTRWLRMFALQIPLYALSVVAVGILSSKRRLALGALAPVATNLMVIAGAVAFAAIGARPALGSVTGSQVALLGWATTAGVGVMAAIQLWGARRAQPGLRLRFAPRDPVVARIGRLARWVLLYVGVNQVGLAVVIGLASSVPGGISAYQWGFTVMQLPYALIAVSIYSAAYPVLARVASTPAMLTAEVARAAEHSIVLLLPAAAGLAVLSRPLAVAVVGVQGASLVAAALRGFAVSLLPFSIFQLLTRASYAREDTRTPALINVVVNATNVAVNLALLAVLRSAAPRVAALALGHAASYVVGCLVLGWALTRRGVLGGAPLAFAVLAKTAAATAVMAGVLVLVVVGQATPSSQAGAAVQVLWASALGLVVFGAVAAALGIGAITVAGLRRGGD